MIQSPVYTTVVTEDELSEVVLKQLIERYAPHIAITHYLGKKGYSYIDSHIKKFDNAAHNGAVIVVLRDLDKKECAPYLIKNMLPTGCHPRLLIRIPVREIEAWLIADTINLSNYLGISAKHITNNVESISDPKEYLVNLARKSRRKDIKESIVPRENASFPVGSLYNDCMKSFVTRHWDSEVARKLSDSLDRTIRKLETFRLEPLK